MILLILGLILMASDSLNNDQKEIFYYARDKKIPLLIKENTLIVKFIDGFDKEKTEQFLKGYSSFISIKWIKPLIAEIVVESERLKEQLKSELYSKDLVYTIQPLYTLDTGYELIVTDEIVLKFLHDISFKQQMALHKQYNTTIIKSSKVYNKIKIPKGADALEIANKYYETGLFKFSHPTFIGKFELLQEIPNDPYFNKQITCRNTGQSFLPDGHSGSNDADIDAPEAWEITKGCSDIIVAVLDQGVTSNHPDLPNTRQIRLDESNFADGNEDDPSPTGNLNHGNACAGVIAATMNNYKGIAGIAPNCRIMPIRIFNSNNTHISYEDVASAIVFAVDNGAKILNISWGAAGSSEDVIAAIEYAINEDCIVVAGAGNNALHNYNTNGEVLFPANVDVDGVITVGASDRNDDQANYSPTSSSIDIVAPSSRDYSRWLSISGEYPEMWSIDIPGSSGYNPWPSEREHPPEEDEEIPDSESGYYYLAFTSRFGGTSHSCAVVSGIAALIVSLNPELNSEEVLDILKSTAEKVGGFNYTSGRCNEMGYGRVNAYQAVLATTGGPISGNTLLCQSPNTTFTYSNPPAGTTVTWTKSSKLEYISGQSTNFYTVRAYSWASGPGWVKASLNSACEGLKYNVWVGPPTLEVTGPSEGYTYNTYTFYADPIGPYSSASNYNWVLNPEYGNHVYNYGDYADIAFYDPYDGYQVLARAQNTCGTGNYAVWNIFIYNYWEEYSISPNPASEIVTISVAKSSISNPTAKELKAEDLNKTYTIRIFDFYGNLHFSCIRSGESFTIPVSNLRDGNYFVQINAGKRISNLKLVIKH